MSQSNISNSMKGQWEILETNIIAVFRNCYEKVSFEKLYHLCYSMTIQQCSTVIYFGLKHIVRHHINENIFPMLSKCSSKDLLKTFSITWSTYKKSVYLVSDILMYMDNNYLSIKNMDSVQLLAYNLFKELVLLKMKVSLSQQLLTHFEKLYAGEFIEACAVNNIKSVCEMLYDIDNTREIYKQFFNNPYVDITESYFLTIYQELLQHQNCMLYINRVNNVLDNEINHVNQFTHHMSLFHVQRLVYKVFQLDKIDILLNMEHGSLLQFYHERNYTELSKIYNYVTLFKNKEFQSCTYNPLEIFEMHCHKMLNDEISNIDLKVINFEEKMTALENIYDFLSAFKIMTTKVFVDYNVEFLKSNIVNFVNSFGGLEECIAMFICNNISTFDTEDGQFFLDIIFIILPHLHNKDVFNHYYQKFLSKKLLSEKYEFSQNDKLFVKKLLNEFGYDNCKKLKNMVDDIEFSLNYTETFYSNYENLERNTQFYVLQSLSWPCSNVPEYLLLPDELNSAFKLFQDEYVQEYSTRKLLIHPKLSTATLDFFKYDENDNCKLYSLCVNTYHLMVLYLFNQKSTLSFKEISTLTRIEDEQAKFTIKQLIDIGLLKEDNINKYNENIYSINEDFESNSSNILNLEDVNHVLTRNNQFTYTLNENRQLLINSIISNIMKKHKSLTIKKIVDEVKLKVDSYFDCTHNMVTDGLYYLVYRAHILEIDEKECTVYYYIP